MQCLASGKSTSRPAMPGCSVKPKAAAAGEAMNMMRLIKAFGSPCAPGCAPDSVSADGEAGDDEGTAADDGDDAVDKVAAVEGAASVTTDDIAASSLVVDGVATDEADAAGFGAASGSTGRAVPSELKRRRSVTLKVGVSSLIYFCPLSRTLRFEHTSEAKRAARNYDSSCSYSCLQG